MRKRATAVAAASALVASLALAPAVARAATISVNTTADQFNTGAAECSLREAVEAANANAAFGGCISGEAAPGVDTVALGNGTHTLTISGDDDTNALGDLDLLSGGALVLDGSGAASTTIDATGLGDRVIHNLGSTTTTITDLKLTGGSTSGAGGGALNGGSSLSLERAAVSDNFAGSFGGGLASAAGTLRVSDSEVLGNDTLNLGAGVRVTGAALEIDSSVIRANSIESSGPSAVVRGGGVSVETGSTATLTDSVVRGNTATATGSSSSALGGGLYALASAVTVRHSTISQNAAVATGSASGGGTFVSGVGAALTLMNTTVDGNVSSGATVLRGGGIHAESSGSASLVHSTVSDNAASAGGGDAVSALGGTVTARASILDGQSFGDVCAGTISSGGYNVARGLSCVLGAIGDVEGGNVLLEGGLADNGGPDVGLPGQLEPLRTRAITAGSPAADNVPAASCLNESLQSLRVDQRGFPRPYPTSCDSGAYERIGCAGAAADVVGTGGSETINGSAAGDDVINGLGGDDVINGLGGDDTICGEDGADTLVGGRVADGGDVLSGGPGADRVSYALRTNPVSADPDGVADDGEGCPGGGCEGDSVGTDIEQIEGGTAGDFLVGGPGADGLIGNEGDDMLLGGAGADALLGLAGADTVSYADRGALEPVSARIGTLTGNGNADDGAGDNLANGIEIVVGGLGNDTLAGDINGNVLAGGAGADTADYSGAGPVTINLALGGAGGAQGDDQLTSIENATGSSGDDLLVSGSANNVLNGAGGNDTVAFGALPMGVSASLETGSASGQGSDSLTAIENLQGSAFADALSGNADPNVIEGLGGNDSLSGAGSVDTLRLGAGDDAVGALDGLSDTIDCAGGGADTGTVDLSPAETYFSCANTDGDALIDLLDSCPTQAGSQANGCPPDVSTPPPPPKKKRKCKKGSKWKQGKCVKKRKKHPTRQG